NLRISGVSTRPESNSSITVSASVRVRTRPDSARSIGKIVIGMPPQGGDPAGEEPGLLSSFSVPPQIAVQFGLSVLIRISAPQQIPGIHWDLRYGTPSSRIPSQTDL